LAERTGLVPLGEIPFDPASAAVVTGASASARRLERSHLLASVRRVGDALADRSRASDPLAAAAEIDIDTPGDPVRRSTFRALPTSFRAFGRHPLADGSV